MQLKEAEAQQEEAVKEANRIELALKGHHKIWEQLKNGKQGPCLCVRKRKTVEAPS